MDLFRLSATEMVRLLRNKQVTAVELATAHFERITHVEPLVDAFLSVNESAALSVAKTIDDKIAKGDELQPLAGIPIAIKDNICTKGIATTCASKMLENFVPPYNATVIERLITQDFTLLGKTNLDEFAMGSSGENSAFKPTRNPHDVSRVSGGSSSGSAACVAALEAPLSLGSDTGGSIRMPAGLCGIVGFKPTYGAVSRYGLVAFASSLDQIGTFSRTVSDAELLFSAISGKDEKDATSAAYNYKRKDYSIKNMKLGVPKEYFGDGIEPETKTAVLKAIDNLKSAGAEVVEIDLPSTKYALSAYYILSSAEASSNLSRFDGVKYGFSIKGIEDIDELYCRVRSEGFGTEVQRRILLGTFVLSSGYYDAYYKRAKLLQNRIASEFETAFSKCDALITPISPQTAFKLGEKSDPIAMYAADVCTINVNLAGLPAISLPCSKDENGLPIGLQLIGNRFSEAKLFYLSRVHEEIMGGFEILREIGGVR